jgi:hypothetical protein
LEYVLAWSRQDLKKEEEAERVRHLGLFVNLEDDKEAGPSQCRGSGGQGCSSWAAKAEPPSDDDDTDYDVFYQRLGLQ